MTRIPSLPARSTLRKLGIALLVLGVIAGAGCTGIASDGGNGTDPNGTAASGTNAAGTTASGANASLEGVSLIDHVPAEQNLVIHVNGSIAEDATTQAFLQAGGEAAEQQSEATPEQTPEDVDGAELQGSLDEFEESTGLDPREFEEAIYFGQFDDVPESVEAADAEEQFGLIANTGWTTAELTDAIESNDSIEMEALDYEESGVFYELTNAENDAEDPLYLGLLGDGAYVLGVESTVEGTLDVAYADGDALSGTLRDAYDDTRDGFATVAMTIPEDENAGGATTGPGAEISNNMEVLTGTYYTEDGEIGVEGRITMSSENYATQLSATASIFVTQAEQNEDAPAALQHLEIEQDGNVVIVNYGSDVETLIDLTDSA
ncbi:hypothetical protein GCM10028857_25250 [Salinarchaeum chitinilyticum]